MVIAEDNDMKLEKGELLTLGNQKYIITHSEVEGESDERYFVYQCKKKFYYFSCRKTIIREFFPKEAILDAWDTNNKRKIVLKKSKISLYDKFSSEKGKKHNGTYYDIDESKCLIIKNLLLLFAFLLLSDMWNNNIVAKWDYNLSDSTKKYAVMLAGSKNEFVEFSLDKSSLYWGDANCTQPTMKQYYKAIRDLDPNKVMHYELYMDGYQGNYKNTSNKQVPIKEERKYIFYASVPYKQRKNSVLMYLENNQRNVLMYMHEDKFKHEVFGKLPFSESEKSKVGRVKELNKKYFFAAIKSCNDQPKELNKNEKRVFNIFKNELGFKTMYIYAPASIGAGYAIFHKATYN